MATYFTNRTLFTTAFAAAAMASVISMGVAKAGTAGNLHQCDSNDPSYTVQCCESLVRNKEAAWIRNSGKSCKSLTTCTGVFGHYKCYVRKYDPPKNGPVKRLKPKYNKPVINSNQGGAGQSGGGGGQSPGL
jgi:hypothetical protein